MKKRQAQILEALMQKGQTSASELAAQLNVSTRTVYRDLEELTAQGVPLNMTKGRGGGVSIDPAYVAEKAQNPKNPTESQPKNLVLKELLYFYEEAEDKADKIPDEASEAEEDAEEDFVGFDDGFAPGFRKAAAEMSYLPQEEKQTSYLPSADWIEIEFASMGAGGSLDAENFETIKSAILQRRVISFYYAAGRGERARREAEPLKLCLRDGAWHIYAHCRSRHEERYFKLRRMKQIEMSEESFEREAPARLFSAEDEVEYEKITLKLKLSPRVAFRVYDEFVDFESLPEGGFIARTRMQRGEDMFAYIAGFGEHCEVLEPKDIRTGVVARLKKALENYD